MPFTPSKADNHDWLIQYDEKTLEPDLKCLTSAPMEQISGIA
jgi:hypothetical protein